MPPAAVRLSAAAVADIVGGRLGEGGDGSIIITAVGSLDQARGGALSFLTSAKYLEDFSKSAASVVLVPASLRLPSDQGPKTRIVVADPHQALAKLLPHLFPEAKPSAGIHPTATLGRSVTLGNDVSIGPFAIVGDAVTLGDRVTLGPRVVLEAGVEVGDDSELGPGVTCYRGSRVGRRVRIKAGGVIGGTGFGYISDRSGHHPILHVGGCVIGDDVDIGSNSCVDRGSIDDTIVGSGTKLDNHVHIGHNARLGERCLVMGGSVIAGSARLGNDVVLAGHTAVAGHFKVGDRVRVGAKSGVISEVPPGTDVSGFPARPHREFLKAQAALYRLAPLVGELEALATQKKLDG